LNSNPYGIIKVNKGIPGIVSTLYAIYHPRDNVYANFIQVYFEQHERMNNYMHPLVNKGAKNDMKVTAENALKGMVTFPSREEQYVISAFFSRLDSLITLHQRKYDGCTLSPIFFRKVHTMQENITSESLFCDYYAQWVRTYKEGAIRDVTMGKYRLTQSWLSKLIPELRLADMDRTAYQQLINGYAQHHERQTTMDFHHQIKGAILDAVDEGLIPRDPTRKVIIKGKQPRIKKMKYLNQFELHAMLADLDLGDEASWDWLILLIAKTGLRFSEALGLTPDDFDFAHQTLSVSKTWDYKNSGGFVPTKNESSVRKVQLDWQLIMQLSGLLKNLPHDKPIFVHGKVYNSTANDVLARHCKNVDVPVISIHGLRHTHASLLLFAGVSIASVSRRLGHASMTTTQETYLHVIRELENKDVDIVMRALSTLI
jgi:integrase